MRAKMSPPPAFWGCGPPRGGGHSVPPFPGGPGRARPRRQNVRAPRWHAGSILARVALAALSLLFLSACSPAQAHSRPPSAVSGTGLAARASSSWRNGDQSDMVVVPAGRFLMGGNPIYEGQPPRWVDLPSFSIDRTEVTNGQFAAFIGQTGYRTEAERAGEEQTWRSLATPGRENYPVVFVTGNDASAYCQWAEKRLPTEEEWEKAARGTDGRLWPWGNQFDPASLNSAEGGVGATRPVGSYPQGASPFGALDLAGNVWEWTSSLYSSPLAGNPPADADTFQGQRVLRGGSWRTIAPGTQSSYRKPARTDYRRDSTGFRCAR